MFGILVRRTTEKQMRKSLHNRMVPAKNSILVRFHFQNLIHLFGIPLKLYLNFAILCIPRHSTAFRVSRARADHYSTYPRLGNDHYYHLPITKETVGGIGRELFDNDSLLKTKTDSLEKLIAFVRNGFEYRTDLETCGIEHFSLSAEEVLAGRGADCEDKVALLWQLQKELIGLPMVVLEFETHVSLAIAAPYNEFYADPIEYKGEKFYVADPSIEKDSPESNLPMIGSWPFGLFGLPFDFGPSWAPGD